MAAPLPEAEPTPSPKTLRDEFAMAAMGGISYFVALSDEQKAIRAYAVADAMMKEREKKNET
jgi:hypothetical protein